MSWLVSIGYTFPFPSVKSNFSGSKAVDSHVARHIFGNGLDCSLKRARTNKLFVDQVIGPYGLLAMKARILVTNSIAFLRQYDKTVFLRRGIIVESGSYEELTSMDESYVSKLV